MPFSQHTTSAQQVNCDTYFAKPYQSWERDQNEMPMGFPKSMELVDVSLYQVYDAVYKLNDRPRNKTLSL